MLFIKSGIVMALTSLTSVFAQEYPDNVILENTPLHVFELDQYEFAEYDPASPLGSPASLSDRAELALGVSDELHRTAALLEAPFQEHELKRLARLFPSEARERRLTERLASARAQSYPVDDSIIEKIARGELTPEQALEAETEEFKRVFYQNLAEEIERARRTRHMAIASLEGSDVLIENQIGLNELPAERFLSSVDRRLIQNIQYTELVFSHLEHEAARDAEAEALQIMGRNKNPAVVMSLRGPNESMYSYIDRTQKNAKRLAGHFETIAKGYDKVAVVAATERVRATRLPKKLRWLDQAGWVERLHTYLTSHTTPDSVRARISNRATSALGNAAKGAGTLGVIAVGYEAWQSRKNARMPRISAQDSR